ncbi:MAG: manganese efflux pump [Clostridia bacterium]|nr:manganese efflux pump [Clostridia bacterium]
MDFLELLGIAVGLSMDAFAVSLCKGLAAGKAKPANVLTVGIYFGGFQALMPLIGYLISSLFSSFISSVAAWVAFILLLLIGGNMIRESLQDDDEESSINASFSPKSMIPLAVATSIDALATGVAFAAFDVHIVSACSLIGLTTFLISGVGLVLGVSFGSRFHKKAETFGGIILILIGLKILLEHLF